MPIGSVIEGYVEELNGVTYAKLPALSQDLATAVAPIVIATTVNRRGFENCRALGFRPVAQAYNPNHPTHLITLWKRRFKRPPAHRSEDNQGYGYDQMFGRPPRFGTCHGSDCCGLDVFEGFLDVRLGCYCDADECECPRGLKLAIARSRPPRGEGWRFVGRVGKKRFYVWGDPPEEARA